MPREFKISEPGASQQDIDAITDEFFRLRVTRARQPTLLFVDAKEKKHTLTRTSNGSMLFGGIQVKDRDTLRQCVAELLQGSGTVLVGLVEGTTAELGDPEKIARTDDGL